MYLIVVLLVIENKEERDRPFHDFLLDQDSITPSLSTYGADDIQTYK